MVTELGEKIKNLENLVAQNKNELETANHEKENYQKQIKEMKNTIDQLKAELKDQQQQARLSADSLEVMSRGQCFEQEIDELKKTIEKRDQETANYLKKLEELNEVNGKLIEESEKLKTGLATAYAQIFEKTLDQTLAFGDSTILIDQTTSPNSSFNLEELLYKQTNYNNVLEKLSSCRKQLDDYEQEKSRLLKQIEEIAKEKEAVLGKFH